MNGSLKDIIDNIKLKGIAGRLAYGLLFAAVLPALLAMWCSKVDLSLPAVHSPLAGLALTALGLALMLTAMAALWFRGRGLPMNAYPPRALVRDGVYWLFPHPIYLGFTLAVAGISLGTGSPTGLWLGAPLATLLCLALVLGYEEPYLLKTFGAKAEPMFGPPAEGLKAGPARRLGVAAAVLLPWLVFYYGFKALGVPADAMEAAFAFEAGWPVLSWTYPIYASAYLLTPLSFLLVKSEDDLRRYFKAAWLSMGLAFLIYFAVPLVGPARPFEINSPLAALLALDKSLDGPPVNAFPSYHVIWSALAAHYFSLNRKAAAKIMAWLWAILVAFSCPATSYHGLIDIFGGAAVAAVAVNGRSLWRMILRKANRTANSWREKRFRGGRLRVINHAVPAALAGALGFYLAALLAGPDLWPALMLSGLAVIAGAGLWGQALEGSGKLQRPFGFFGGLAGFMLFLAIYAHTGGQAWRLAGAAMAAAPLMQAIGRLRCLVQGCCHGRPVAGGGPGLRVTNPHSRVCGVSGLEGVNIHPTQVYSIIGNLLITVILWRTWALGAPLSFICGLYLILSGAARFMEEGWRGEAQTTALAGLPIYQWLSVGMIAVGFLISPLPSPGAPDLIPSAGTLLKALPPSLFYGLLCGLGMGVDLPLSNHRFARLSD